MIDKIVVGELSTNCYILNYSDDKCVIIDPGADAQRILLSVKKLGYKVTHIVFTHGHLDHIAATAELMDELGNINQRPILCAGTEDKYFFGSGASEFHRRCFEVFDPYTAEIFESVYTPVPSLDIEFPDRMILEGTGLKIIPTPGHTPGSISIYDELNGFIFTGDCLFSNGTGRTDLPGGNSYQLASSIVDNLYTLPGYVRVFPGHGPDSTIERIKRIITIN